MEIVKLRFEELSGIHPDIDPNEFYQGRLSRPIDLYAEFRNKTPNQWMFSRDEHSESVADENDTESFRITQTFLFIETDTDITGVAGPINRTWAYLAAEFEPLLVGRDPRRTEKLWDLMYRQAVHGRKGKTMQAISAIDCALWDIKGKYQDEPLYQLLGGPVREELPSYASMLGYSADPDRVRERATEFKDRGFLAQKWFFRYGRGSGCEGQEHNLALLEAARDATGAQYDLMFDCWMSWDREYALDIFPEVAEYSPRWIEGPSNLIGWISTQNSERRHRSRSRVVNTNTPFRCPQAPRPEMCRRTSV